MEIKKGDKVWILSAITNLNEKIEATVIEVENNPFNGIVVSAKTDDGTIYFGQARYFELKSEE